MEAEIYGEELISLTRIWKNKETPADLQTAVMCPINKKGNKPQYEIYIGLSPAENGI